LAALAFGVVIAARVGSAQSVSASAVMMDARHELLDGDLVGGAIDVRLPIGRRSAMARLGVTRLVGENRRTGAPCGGFILDPLACPPEPLRDDAQFTTMSAGLSDRLLAWPRLRIDLAADLRGALVDVTTHAQTSGRRLSADRWLWGADIALDAAWTPWARLPLAFEVGAAAGGVKPFITDGSLDNYAPFRDAFGTTSLRVGLSWRRGVGER
jgi:hypothetical protein